MIRRFKPTDKEKLVRILKLNVPKNFAPNEIKDFENYLGEEIEDYFVVDSDGDIIGGGGINYFYDSAIARLSWDIIHPDYHGKGIGKELIKYKMKHIKNNPGIKLIVVRTSQMAYRFYEKSGFELEKVEKNFWAKGFDLYQMKQTIIR